MIVFLIEVRKNVKMNSRPKRQYRLPSYMHGYEVDINQQGTVLVTSLLLLFYFFNSVTFNVQLAATSDSNYNETNLLS